jgi:hypothetical protein
MAVPRSLCEIAGSAVFVNEKEGYRSCGGIPRSSGHPSLDDSMSVEDARQIIHAAVGGKECLS